MPIEPNSTLGSYQIVGKLGEGGMGEVYRALDPGLGREVAIKVMPEAVAANRDLRERFRREARLLAAVRHPNVATVFGFEEVDGVPLLVMELVEGTTLASELRKGALELPRALRLAESVARGLEAAHRRGIVHRDLKPANVALTPDGEVKVLDFGLAKSITPEQRVEGEAQSKLRTRTAELTRAGTFLGTVPYMSPEQVRGEEIDERTDVWAFGCLLFETLSGQKPFSGGTDAEIAAAILGQEPDWELLPAETPLPVRRLLRRTLEKDLERRLRDLGDARLDLLDAIEGTGEEAQGVVPVAERRSPRLLSVFTLFLGAAAAVVLLWIARPEATPLPVPVTRALLPLAGPFEESPGTLFELALAPDGGAIAYMLRLSTGERHALFHRRLSELEPRRIVESWRLGAPSFSSDGLWIGYVDDSVLGRASVTGGAPVSTQIRVGNVRGGDSSHEGTVFGSRILIGGLDLVTPEGERRSLTQPDFEAGEMSHRWPAFLPGGDAILFTIVTADTDSYAEASIAIYDFRTDSYEVVHVGGYGARYSPTGHLVYAHSSEILAVPFELDSRQVPGTGTPVQVVDGLHESRSAPLFDLSADGTLVYAPGGPRQIERRVLLVDRRGEVRRVLREGGSYNQPRLSPDGGRLALVIESVSDDIVVIDLERDTEVPVTQRWINFYPRWSDSDHILFQSARSGRFRTHRRRADGTGEIELLFDRPTDAILNYDPTPDGRRALVWDGRLLVHDRLQDELTPLVAATTSRQFDGVLSRNGDWVAFESNKTGEWEIHLRPFPSGEGEWQVSKGGGRTARWGPGDRELLYRAGDRIVSVEIDGEGQRVALGAPRVLFERPRLLAAFDVSPDGQTFVVVEEEEDRPSPTHLVLVRGFDQELRDLQRDRSSP